MDGLRHLKSIIYHIHLFHIIGDVLHKALCQRPNADFYKSGIITARNSEDERLSKASWAFASGNLSTRHLMSCVRANAMNSSLFPACPTPQPVIEIRRPSI